MRQGNGELPDVTELLFTYFPIRSFDLDAQLFHHRLWHLWAFFGNSYPYQYLNFDAK